MPRALSIAITAPLFVAGFLAGHQPPAHPPRPDTPRSVVPTVPHPHADSVQIAAICRDLVTGPHNAGRTRALAPDRMPSVVPDTTAFSMPHHTPDLSAFRMPVRRTPDTLRARLPDGRVVACPHR